MFRQYQHYYALIRWKNGKTASDIHAELVIGEGDQALSFRQIQRWIAAFKEGQEVVEDKPRSGRPREVSTTEVIGQLQELVSNDPHATTREMSDLLGISRERITHILNKELNMQNGYHIG